MGVGVSAGAGLGEGGTDTVEVGGTGIAVASSTGADVGLGTGAAVAVGLAWTAGIDVAGGIVAAGPPPQAVKAAKASSIAVNVTGNTNRLLLISPSNAESAVPMKSLVTLPGH